MFTHILVPLDGSTLAESALPAARFFADQGHARITLIHILERKPPAAIHGDIHLQTAEEAARYLEAVAGRAFSSGTRVDCHVHTDAVRSVAGGLAAHAGEIGHDLIVMCSHGNGRTSRLFLGSIAQKIVNLGTLPVLITLPPEPNAPPASFQCRTLMVPLDGNREHIQALNVAVEIARDAGSELVLPLVVHRFETLTGTRSATSRLLPGTTAEFLELAAQSAQEFLDAKQKELKQAGIPSRILVLRGDPAQAVGEAAQTERADLLVLGTHGRSGLEAFWSGSVAHRICSASRIPILLVPLAPA